MKLLLPILLLALLLCSSCDTPEATPAGERQKKGSEPQPSRSTGIWENGSFVDELGVTADRPCIRSRGSITGSFSNSVTPHSPLNVTFLVFGPNGISLQLFENGGKDPVKALTPVSYTVTIVDADGNPHKVKAMNTSDKIVFERTDAKAVHDVLMKGGKIRFSIANDFNPAVQYEFTIDNATGYDAAFKTMIEK